MTNHGRPIRVVLHYEDGFMERVSPAEAEEKLREAGEDDPVIPGMHASAAHPYFAVLYDKDGRDLDHTSSYRIWSEALDAALLYGDEHEDAKRLEVYRWSRAAVASGKSGELAKQRGSVRERARVRWHIVE